MPISRRPASHWQSRKRHLAPAIIGAGLNAAYQLKKAGIRADVYEAGARVGGRVLTHAGLVGKGFTIELGAEFINSDHLDMYLGARPDVTLYPRNRRR